MWISIREVVFWSTPIIIIIMHFEALVAAAVATTGISNPGIREQAQQQQQQQQLPGG